MKMNTKSKAKTSGNKMKEMELKFKNLNNLNININNKDKNLGISLSKVTSLASINNLGMSKSILNSFRPGLISSVIGRKYKTGKNSRKDFFI
jgi:hypothetical protein